MLTLSRGVQPCTHADSTLCSMRYWLVPLVTGLFLACSACYWLVPWLFRLLLTCSLLVPPVTGLFRLFRVLETSVFVDVVDKVFVIVVVVLYLFVVGLLSNGALAEVYEGVFVGAFRRFLRLWL